MARQQGENENDPKIYDKVLAVAYLYGAPGQLVTRAGSGIKKR